MERKINFRNWKIVITIGSLLIVILCKINFIWSYLVNNYIDINVVREILYDLCIGIFAALILVWAINERENIIKEEELKKNEREAIKRVDRVIQLYIDKYKKFYYCVVTPISSRDFSDISMKEDFKLSDMRDMFKNSILNNQSLSSSSIENFLSIELELRENINSIIASINFDYYPEIVSLLIKFVECSMRFESRGAILDVKNQMFGGVKYTKIMEEYLIKDGDKYYDGFKQAGHCLQRGHYLNPYIFLAEMMKEERRLLIAYEKEIDNLKGDSNNGN